MIGIIGAMAIEVEGLKRQMEGKRVETWSGVDFFLGRIAGVECVMAMCGVGKVNAAVCAQTMLLCYKPSIVINTGVAGGMGEGVAIGDIVVATDVVQHDMDTTAVGDPKGWISGIDQVHIPCSPDVAQAVIQVADGSSAHCHSGTVATGDQFINDKTTLNRIKREFGAIACEMEGAAIGQACYLSDVPFAVVRAISDNANDESHVDYQEFVGPAAQRSIQLITRLLPLLKNGAVQ